VTLHTQQKNETMLSVRYSFAIMARSSCIFYLPQKVGAEHYITHLQLSIEMHIITNINIKATREEYWERTAKTPLSESSEYLPKFEGATYSHHKLKLWWDSTKQR
jgi:hypothetical protein